MKYRRLGRTDLTVSVVGFGAWQFGGEWGQEFTPAEVYRLLGRAKDLGINLIDTVQTGEIGAADGNLLYDERPDWFKNWETTGLLSFEDKNGDGRIQYYNDKNEAFAAKAESYGWKGNEMTKVDRDIMVLANPDHRHHPPKYS